jgi:hypothetical protein
MCIRRPKREPRSKATILLLVILYLGIFTAHDLIFLAPEAHSGEAGTDEPPTYTEGQRQEISIDAVNDHVCPFCSGFVDNHAVVELTDSSFANATMAIVPEEAAKDFIPSFNNPRDPPFLSI